MNESSTPALSREPSEFHFQHQFAHDNPGRLEDFYDIDAKRLGEGSFGSVFRATCKKTSVPRAVKAIEISSVKNPARLEAEVGIKKQLDHPNVVRLFEMFQDARKIYLVMELCTGGELFERILKDAPHGFDEILAARYVRQILSSLCYLHSHRFAHRDVKPENFIFQNESPDSSLKIIDFGLACRFEPGQKMTTKAGTAYYVAPEVLSGSYDVRCDVWSAGVISFILLCGYPPFSGDTDAQILRSVKVGTFEFRSPEWDSISDGAKNLITQMLTVDPALRVGADILLLNPWLRFKGEPSNPAPMSVEYVNRLQSFQALAKLKKVALTAIAQQLPDEQIHALQETFRALDQDGDGRLSPEEVREGLVKQGIAVPLALDSILRRVDCNNSGGIDYTEWLAATIDHKLYMQRDVLWTAFRVFDLDGDGRITREELDKVLNGDHVQKTLGASRIDQMIQQFDLNGDGIIDFEEFCAMMKPHELERSAKRQRVGG